MTVALLSLACWYLHIRRIADRLGMTWVGASWTSVEHVWKPVLNSQNLATWLPYIEIWWINSKVPEGSMITSENSSATRENSRVIILKSRLGSTGHSPARARFVTFLIVRPMYPMSDDSWCSRTFSNLETAAIQWQRPSVILQLYNIKYSDLIQINCTLFSSNFKKDKERDKRK